MVGGVEGVVEQSAQLLGRAGRIDVVDRVAGLGAGHVVRLGADAADPGGDPGEFLHRPAHAKLLEAPQLGDAQIGVGHVPVVIEEDVDAAVTLQAGDRVDGDRLHV